MSSVPVYIEYNHPSFGYAIGLFTLQCVVVLTLLSCMSFCMCCGLGISGSKDSSSLQLNPSKFKITKYSDIRHADKEYFKLNIQKSKNTKTDNKVDKVDKIDNKMDAASTLNTDQINISTNVINEETKNESNSESNNIKLETDIPTKSEIPLESTQEETKSKLDSTSIITDAVINTKTDVSVSQNQSKLGLIFKILFCPFRMVVALVSYVIRILSCGKLCKKPIIESVLSPVVDVENKKKKYLLYKFNNFDIDDVMDNPEQYIKSNPYKNLKEFIEIVHTTYNSEDLEILLHISSPGGIAFKFEELYSHLERLTKKGFVITALVDNLCASGGYMLASGCSKIIASPYAKIGSVGVICSAVNYYELSQKLGLEHKTFKTGEYKGSFPTGEKYTKDDEDRMNELLNETLKMFSGMVKKARNLTDEELAVVLSAKVWYGESAIEKKLVDVLCLPDDYVNDLSVSSDVFVVTVEQKKKSMFGTLSGLSSISEKLELITEQFIEYFEIGKNVSDVFKIKLE